MLASTITQQMSQEPSITIENNNLGIVFNPNENATNSIDVHSQLYKNQVPTITTQGIEIGHSASFRDKEIGFSSNNNMSNIIQVGEHGLIDV
jgi:hypothetical protein